MLKWKRKVGNHTNGHNGYLGEVKVFSTDYSVNRNEKYVLYSFLPGLEVEYGIYLSDNKVVTGEEKEIMGKAEELVEKWLKKAGLEVKG